MSLKRLASLGGSEAPIVRRQLRELAEEADERERERERWRTIRFNLTAEQGTTKRGIN